MKRCSTSLIITVGGNVSWYSGYGKQYGGVSKLKSELPYVLAIPLLGQNCNSKRQMHPYLQSTTIHNSQNRETT